MGSRLPYFYQCASRLHTTTQRVRLYRGIPWPGLDGEPSLSLTSAASVVGLSPPAPTPPADPPSEISTAEAGGKRSNRGGAHSSETSSVISSLPPFDLAVFGGIGCCAESGPLPISQPTLFCSRAGRPARRFCRYSTWAAYQALGFVCSCVSASERRLRPSYDCASIPPQTHRLE